MRNLKILVRVARTPEGRTGADGGPEHRAGSDGVCPSSVEGLKSHRMEPQLVLIETLE